MRALVPEIPFVVVWIFGYRGGLTGQGQPCRLANAPAQAGCGLHSAWLHVARTALTPPAPRRLEGRQGPPLSVHAAADTHEPAQCTSTCQSNLAHSQIQRPHAPRKPQQPCLECLLSLKHLQMPLPAEGWGRGALQSEPRSLCWQGCRHIWVWVSSLGVKCPGGSSSARALQCRCRSWPGS